MLVNFNLEGLEEKDVREIKYLLQTINDKFESGITTNNLSNFMNTYVINEKDSLDASYPMYVHFNIINEMINIVSVKVSFWILNYRAYSTAASSGGAVSSASGGGETPTSSSGGEVTSASGGGETPTSSSVSTPSGGGSTSGATGSASGGGSTSGSGGGQTSGATDTAHQHTIQLANQTSGQAVIYGNNSFGCSGGGTVPTLAGGMNHTHTVANHTHTTPAHTHPNHTHSTPNHTHPNHTHTVTIAAHTHTGGAHTHTVTVAAHTHTGGAHTHDITYGIHEEENSPTIKFHISDTGEDSYSNTFFGGFTTDKANIDITDYITTVGSKMIKFTSTTRTRLSVQIEVKLAITAR